MQDFLNPEYFAAVGTAILNGLYVFAGMCVVASVFVFGSGASSAKDWKKEAAH
ncbi:MAG: hypothetical protein AB7S38_36620 [Vulcanimicrobiota bacterium]